MIRSDLCSLKVPAKNVKRIDHYILQLSNEQRVTYRENARLAGLLISVTQAVGPIARLFTRQMYYAVLNRKNWDDAFVMSSALLEEIKFWHQHIRALNGYSIRPNLQSYVSLFTDASKLGFGGHSPLFKNIMAADMFNEQDKGTSSTERELTAIYHVLQSYKKNLKCKKVKVFSDNQSACKILVVGSRKHHLQRLAVNIFKLSAENNLLLESQWIPREGNKRADQISKFLDKDDWQLNRSSFRLIDARWGPHTCDRFASHYNAQLSRFNSRFASPGAERPLMHFLKTGIKITTGYLHLQE